VDVYLKAKDPIEKAKRVQKKSAAAPGSHRPGGSDRAIVSDDSPEDDSPEDESPEDESRLGDNSRLEWGQPIGAKP